MGACASRPETTGGGAGLCGTCGGGKNEPTAGEEQPALVFAKTVSESMSSKKIGHKRADSRDVEVYVRGLFETRRNLSSNKKIEQHRSLTTATRSLKKNETLKAAQLERTPFSTAALQEAAFGGQADAVSRLVRQGYDVNERYVNFETPLHVAAEGGHAAMARELLRYGADPLAVDKDGWTALHHAAMQGQVGCVKELIKWAAESEELSESHLVNAVDEEGLAPLHCAVHVRNYTATPDKVDRLREVAKLLTEAGADVNRANRTNGWTPLHIAVQSGHVALVEELLAQGADDTLEDGCGKLPLDYACNSKGTQFRSREISRLLAELSDARNPGEASDNLASGSVTPQSSMPSTPRASFIGGAGDQLPSLSAAAIAAARRSPAPTPPLSPRDSPRQSPLPSPRLTSNSPLYWDISEIETPRKSDNGSQDEAVVSPQQVELFPAAQAKKDGTRDKETTAAVELKKELGVRAQSSGKGTKKVILPYTGEEPAPSPRLARAEGRQEAKMTVVRKPNTARRPSSKSRCSKVRATLSPSPKKRMAATTTSMRRVASGDSLKSQVTGTPPSPAKPRQEEKQQAKPEEKKVHYTRSGIAFVYELEDNNQ